jgi:hypothetical protein
VSYAAPNTTLTPCQYLQQLDQAYLALMSGVRVRSVTDENGENTQYTTANSVGLLTLIRVLACTCPTYTPISLGVSAIRRPLRPYF